MSQTSSTSTRERSRYDDLRKRSERQERRREQRMERLIELQHDRRLHSRDIRSAATIELIEGPAPAEDSSVPPDPAE